jgi:hypothetical protein
MTPPKKSQWRHCDLASEFAFGGRPHLPHAVPTSTNAKRQETNDTGRLKLLIREASIDVLYYY